MLALTPLRTEADDGDTRAALRPRVSVPVDWLFLLLMLLLLVAVTSPPPDALAPDRDAPLADGRRIDAEPAVGDASG